MEDTPHIARENLATKISWSKNWSDLLIQNNACTGSPELAKIWSSKELAYAFWEKTRAQINFYEPILQEIPVQADERVLDIGTGPGTMAIPLARRGAKIIAIEPAPGMVAVLSDNIQSNQISNITVINNCWESVRIEDIGLVDHVIACFSLGMQNIKESLEKMDRISTKSVTLVWFSGKNAWDQMMEGLCTGTCGLSYTSGPKSDLLYPVLNEIGIYPDVRHIHTHFFERFESYNEALILLNNRCRSSFLGKEESIRKWMHMHLIKDGDGYLWNPKVIITILQWKKGLL